MIQAEHGWTRAAFSLAPVLYGVLLLSGCAGTPVAPSEPRAGALPAASGGETVAAIDLAALQHDAEEVVAGLRWNREGKVYAAAVEGTSPNDLTVSVALVDGRSFSVGKTDARRPF